MALIGINASFARRPSTGIGQVTLNFLKELARRKTEHEFVLYLEEALPKDIILPKNFRQEVFLPIWKRDDLVRKIWWEKYMLPKKMEHDRCCDIFISLYQCPTIFPEKVKHLMVVHDLIPRIFPEYLNNARKKAYQDFSEGGIHHADKIIAVSSRTEKDLIQMLEIDPKKITVAYPDVDPIFKKEVSQKESAEVLKKYRLKPGYLYFGGGLDIRKNAEGLLQAYKSILERNKNEHFLEEIPKLVISGKMIPQMAPLITDVSKLVKEMNLSTHVRLLDLVPQKFLPALYKNACLFVYPSKYEGFGLPVLEAMNQGTPVIAGKTSSLPEVGKDGILYFDPEDTEDLMMVMKNAMLKDNLREAVGKRGKERAQDFSWEKFVDKILNILDN